MREFERRVLYPLLMFPNSDFVAVYMTNSAEAYISTFALSKLGVTNAMINSSLRGILVELT
jgi:acyl-CoA synthetase (AMP-forming)/AMP-acid ligase II